MPRALDLCASPDAGDGADALGTQQRVPNDSASHFARSGKMPSIAKP
jgi:hypothetical protein